MSNNEPIAAVRQYLDGFNKGDARVMAASFAKPGQSLTAWHHTSGRGQQPLKTGIGTC